MRIFLHIGPDGPSSDRLQRVMEGKRAQLLRKGVLFPRSPGGRNHTRLFMAVTDPERVDSLRFNRGFADPARQMALREDVLRGLRAEIDGSGAETMILSCHQLGTGLVTGSELERLKALLVEFSKDIRVIAHLDDPARMLVRRYAGQVFDGRGSDLVEELALLQAPDFRAAALDAMPDPDPDAAVFAELQSPAFWLDFKGLQAAWQAVFGAVTFQSLDPALLYSERGTEAVRLSFGIEKRIGKTEAEPLPVLPSASWLTRCRQFNAVLLKLIAARNLTVPRPLWRKFMTELKLPGTAIDPGSLHAISARFASDIKDLCEQHPGLDLGHLAPDPATEDYREADPRFGFRATQYLAAWEWRVMQGDKEAKAAEVPDAPTLEKIDEALSPAARALLPPRAKQTFAHIGGSIFAPHNALGTVDEEQEAEPFEAVTRPAPQGNTGRVVIGCMKNEAPYILEWIAHHRAIGVDNFIIYTNDCDDGTDAILERLQALGFLQHRDNAQWTGKSPQQFALDAALSEPLVRQADWLMHIDVDEFINVRCGNGTLDDFLARVPEATNVAMTWRLFGHGGVTAFEDKPVIAQFTDCAPRHCPKPHTVWGYKTLFRNIGAYEKLSCHRPNRLVKDMESQVKWVNGNGQDMTLEAIRNGWRSSKRSIGYDLLQLNHYALRSAESFLVKRQRGRALHVDRAIGLNYWIRMDWSGARDITIQRNLPRVGAELARLKADPELARLHEAGVAWHRDKAAELRQNPEFAELYAQALALRLTPLERVAYALSLDMES